MYALVLPAHQKIDHVAFRRLGELKVDMASFPTIRQIVHFEGRNGPDASKLKKQPHSQPWHFVDPFDAEDDDLAAQITGHHAELVKALHRKDKVRAAFEAAWLAHALVDGLTPAHHYPYEEELESLRGEDRDTRKGLVGRAYVQGETIRQSVERSLKLVGPGGLLTTHALFEAGAGAIIMPLRLTTAKPTRHDMAVLNADGVVGVFNQLAKEVADLNLYGRFYVTGWTPRLSRDIRRELAPRMVRAVTLAWYSALQEAGKKR